jgi:GTP-binding protein
MLIHSAKYVISAASPAQFPKRPIPHFVFAGRSNVGKSSILNKILGRKGLAKTSGKPGKTRYINYFLINDRFYFVDLPGYGYAKVSKAERHSWQQLIEAYLTQTDHIRMLFSLVDARHDPSPLDTQLQDWLLHYHLPFKVLLTKSDKLSRNKAANQVNRHSRLLEVPRSDIILSSAETGLGVNTIWKSINEQLNQENSGNR